MVIFFNSNTELVQFYRTILDWCKGSTWSLEPLFDTLWYICGILYITIFPTLTPISVKKNNRQTKNTNRHREDEIVSFNLTLFISERWLFWDISNEGKNSPNARQFLSFRKICLSETNSSFFKTFWRSWQHVWELN